MRTTLVNGTRCICKAFSGTEAGASPALVPTVLALPLPMRIGDRKPHVAILCKPCGADVLLHPDRAGSREAARKSGTSYFTPSLRRGRGGGQRQRPVRPARSPRRARPRWARLGAPNFIRQAAKAAPPPIRPFTWLDRFDEVTKGAVNLECGDMSPLWIRATCRPGRKARTCPRTPNFRRRGLPAENGHFAYPVESQYVDRLFGPIGPNNRSARLGQWPWLALSQDGRLESPGPRLLRALQDDSRMRGIPMFPRGGSESRWQEERPGSRAFLPNVAISSQYSGGGPCEIGHPTRRREHSLHQTENHEIPINY